LRGAWRLSGKSTGLLFQNPIRDRIRVVIGELFIHYPEVHLMGQTHLDAHYQSWQQIILFGCFDLSEAQPCTE